MKEAEFLARLGEALGPEDRDEVLADYRDHFAEARAGGRTDEETAEALGSPEALAAEFGSKRRPRPAPAPAPAPEAEPSGPPWPWIVLGGATLALAVTALFVSPGAVGPLGLLYLVCGEACIAALGAVWAWEPKAEGSAASGGSHGPT